MDSVRSLIRPLRLSRPDGHARCARFLIYVWAFEQGENSKRKMGVLAPVQESAKPEEQGIKGDGKDTVGQDVMVPWVLQPKPVPKAKAPKRMQKGQGRRCRVEESAEASEPVSESPVKPAEAPLPADHQAPQMFHRYYHLFVHGELSTLVQDAGRAEGFHVVDSVPPPPPTDGTAGGKWLRVVEEGYEKDNWWLEGEVGLY